MGEGLRGGGRGKKFFVTLVDRWIRSTVNVLSGVRHGPSSAPATINFLPGIRFTVDLSDRFSRARTPGRADRHERSTTVSAIFRLGQFSNTWHTVRKLFREFSVPQEPALISESGVTTKVARLGGCHALYGITYFRVEIQNSWVTKKLELGHLEGSTRTEKVQRGVGRKNRSPKLEHGLGITA